MAPRVLLFTGKGGVGKTTVAAATAVHAARAGLKTLVLSTDSAHSLADSFDLASPAAVPGGMVAEVEPGLCALHVDARSRAVRSWDRLHGYFRAVLDAAGVDPLVAEELSLLPGVDDLLVLFELREQVSHGPWDLVVVDCAPSAETLRLLAAPEVVRWAASRVMPSLPALLRLGRPLLARAGAGVPLPGAGVVEAAGRLQAELTDLDGVLRAESTSMRLVVTPESVVLAEARRALTRLTLHGFRVDGVVANRLIPGGDGGVDRDRWRDGWAMSQARRLSDLAASFAGLPLWSAPYLPAEPVGPDALAELAGLMYDAAGEPAWAACATPPPMRVSRVGGEFALELDLPLASADDVRLDRRGDELWVQVTGHQRVIALPSALRRCEVTGAAVRAGVLRVGFRLDPDQYPDGWGPL